MTPPGALGRFPHKRELGQRRGADVGFYADTGRKSAHSGTSAWCHKLLLPASTSAPGNA